MQFHLPDMTCGGCVRGVTRAIHSVDPKATIDADPAKHQIDVQTTASREQLETALRDAGFPPAA